MPNQKTILVIICGTSGSQANIQPEIETVLKKSKVSYTLKKVKTPPDVEKLIKAEANNYETVAVYGGDGTVVTVIKALAGAKQKLLILPGGTANIVAGELHMGNDPVELMQLFLSGKYEINYYDIAAANKSLFVLDMHSGWWTEAIKSTPRDLKKRFGAIAYGISAIKNLPKAEKQQYELEIDGRRVRFQSYTTLIANQGFQNFLGIPLFPKKHRNGIIQVAAVKSLSPLKLLIWIIGRKFGKRNVGGAIKTYRSHEVIVHKAPKDFVYDDHESQMKFPLTITGGKYQTKIIVPTAPIKISFFHRLITFAGIHIVRFTERVRSFVSGQPEFDYTHLAPHLFVGGTYRNHAYKQFKKWGVTGVVNMRSSAPTNIPVGFEVLHLKTTDWQPPSLESLSKGVEFIQARIAKGEGVYVHCRQGEGRGPTMAAAYLISQGLTVNEALLSLRKARPMAHPNRKQLKRLYEWQEEFINRSIK